MGSTMCYEDIIQEKNVRIKELEIENMELKSKLDKFQSILISGSQSQSDVGRVRRVQRGLGISAEPQCLQSITDITNTSFPQVKKRQTAFIHKDCVIDIKRSSTNCQKNLLILMEI
ncbi:unnamed protein product [Lepeophtheirus salmonis]|uniref:(salmon louse) hypothetical protein n=1 Tax=Lepeophtheirus salmonis TaxID=72036 RepID=A0A7R8H2R4_LEPSM|nr:unnamed protein product [Lepeophtheirus salmonis]CAF2817928.1 unnamed protein product [Lepeophtheirus salmonis]